MQHWASKREKPLTTVRQALAQATESLTPITEEARLDASLLLSHSLQQPRSWLIAHDDDELAEAQLDQFESLCRRRANGEPMAYITGEKEFWSISLKVGPGVLVPRPETEGLVETALAKLPATQCHILDMGTGSGAIACALATERPDATLLAIDASDTALEIAKSNAERLQLNNLRFQISHWFSELSDQRFDLIVSNPPYVEDNDPHLEALQHEPLTALTAGADGLNDLRVIVSQSPEHLTTGGWLLVEHGAEQGQAVQQLFIAAGFSSITTRQDLAGLDRITLGQKA